MIVIFPELVKITETAGAFTLPANALDLLANASTKFQARTDQLAKLKINVQIASKKATIADIGNEGYQLKVSKDGITINANSEAGCFYGIQTLRWLLRPWDLPKDSGANTMLTIICCEIVDYPRFPYRGYMLDEGRYFLGVDMVKSVLDWMALLKLNRFHWHLTEDQGWRIEIKKYPRLTEIGAWRSETIVGRQSRDSAARQFDGVRHGGFYTQDDIREVVAYARDRFVTVIPEIEMPGHAIAAIAAYPELGVDAAGTTVATTFGVFDNILNPTDATVHFMQDVLTEVMGLFPSEFIHVGGDEAAKGRWKASAAVQARIKELGLANEAELQSWFIKQMDTFLTAHKRRLVGWDEILEGGLAPGAVVTSWRGIKGGIAAARADHDVVMAPTSNTYFDYYQSKATVLEPLAIGGYLPLETAYAFEPVPPDLEPQYRKHILGAQGQVWTEYMKTPKQVEYMAYPRMSALAEVVWTPADQKDFGDFSARLDTHLRRLAFLDVNYRAPRPDVATVGGTGK